VAIVADGGGRHLRRRSTPNGLEICGAPPVGEPPGQPRLLSRRNRLCRVGSIELLGGAFLHNAELDEGS